MLASLKFFLGQDDKEDDDGEGDDDEAPPPTAPTREDVYKANSKVHQQSGVACCHDASYLHALN